MTMKECRNLRKLSISHVAKSLDISDSLYEYYENHPEDTPLNIAINFALLVLIPLDEIFFSCQSN